MTDRPLIDRSIIVTGGSRGLGRAMVLALAEAGARVAVGASADNVYLSQTVAAAEAIAGRGRVLPLIGDVGQPADCTRMAQAVLDAFGTIDVLFNNAALTTTGTAGPTSKPPTSFWEIEPETWLRFVATNVNGVFLMARAVVPAMLARRRGKIVNISTSDRTLVRKQGSPYGPSKAFVEAASRIWAQDLEGTGVTVNVLLPGGAFDNSRPDAPDAPPGGATLPASIMRAPAVWLASDLSDGHTGERFIAKSWNEDLPLPERIAAARDQGVALPRIM